MKRTALILLSLFLFCPAGQAQKIVRVTYKSIVNGSEVPGGVQTVLESDGAVVRITTADRQHGRPQIPSPGQSSFIDLAGKRYLQLADMPDGSRISTETPFSELPASELSSDTEVIAGYTCVRSRVVYFSNTIDIWYTRDAGVAGTPSPALGVPEGLVLRIVRNGNSVTEAAKVDVLRKKDMSVALPENEGRMVDRMTFEHLLRESFVTTVTVFDNAVINWEGEVSNPAFGMPDPFIALREER